MPLPRIGSSGTRPFRSLADDYADASRSRRRAAVLRADLADAEREFDRIDAIGDAAAVVRVRLVIGPRIGHLRRALAAVERNHREGVQH